MKLLSNSPVKPEEWRQVKGNGERCRTCGRKQPRLFAREVTDEIRYYYGQAKVRILHKHNRKAQIRFLENYDHVFPIDKVDRVRHFNAGETCVTLLRLLWLHRRFTA
jgi:hypothetical protein